MVVNNVSAVDGPKTPAPQVEVVTKSGTNQFHGGLFHQFQNKHAIGAQTCLSRWWTVFRKNQFGAQVGGPIIRNRTFLLHRLRGLAPVGRPAAR